MCLVSVVTPVYNCEDLIERCLRSVQQQDFKDFEHIIVDDGSTDGTRAILKGFSEKFDNVTVLLQENLGAGAARNKAIRAASGRFIAFLDADDLWKPGKLSTQISFMQSTGVVLTFGDYEIERGDEERSLFTAPESLAFEQLLIDCPIGCLTACYDSGQLGKFFMPETRRGQDWGLWLKILRSGVVAKKYPGIHAIYSVDQSSLSSNKLKKAYSICQIYNNVLGYRLFYSVYLTVRHAVNVIKNKKRS